MKLYGRNPVLERLKSNPKSIRKIFLQENHAEAGYIRSKATKWGIPVLFVPQSKMIKISRSINTQGVLAEIDDFNYVLFDDLLTTATQKQHTILFLDNLNDPQNLGVIIRSVACLGNFSIVLPTHGSVEVTEAVLRVASGGENYVPMAKVANLNRAIASAKEAGFWIAGGVVDGGKNLIETSLPFPLCLVIGSEQKGIREVVRQRLDLPLTIPMAQMKISFNVAQATTVFCYEIAKQKKKQSPQ